MSLLKAFYKVTGVPYICTKNFIFFFFYYFCFSKDISGFAALKRTIREVDDNSPANQPKKKRIHSKKRDVMVSPKKPPNAWHVFLSENMQEVSRFKLLMITYDIFNIRCLVV